MEEIDTFKNPFKEMPLSDIIKAGSVLASISGILYLYGFNLSAKVNILAYVSFTDYLNVVIAWILPALGLTSLIAYFSVDFIALMKPSGEAERESDCPLCEYERHGNKNLKMALGALDLSVLLWVGLALLDVDSKQIILVVTVVVQSLWVVVVAWMYRSAENVIRIGPGNYNMISYYPLILIFSLGLGLSDGIIAGKKSMSSRDIAVVTSATGPQIYGELLFSFDKFVVIRESGHNELTFLPSNKITSIKMPVSHPLSKQERSSPK